MTDLDAMDLNDLETHLDIFHLDFSAVWAPYRARFNALRDLPWSQIRDELMTIREAYMRDLRAFAHQQLDKPEVYHSDLR